MSTVEVLYDFDGQLYGELSIKVGETLTGVIDVQAEWKYGINKNGQQGIFPSSHTRYLEEPLPHLDDDDNDVHSVPGTPTKPQALIDSPPLVVRNVFDLITLNLKQCATIIQRDASIFYQATQNAPTVHFTSSESKFEYFNAKRFTCYNLSLDQCISVSHRFKHFCWLHNRLKAKCPLALIPPLPKKQVFGRFEEEFINRRRGHLQDYMNWIGNHPVLSNSSALIHFLTCSDELHWKLGKRAVEEDSLIELRVEKSKWESELSQSEIMSHLDISSRFIDSLTNNIGIIPNVREIPLYDLTREAHGISMLAESLEIDEQRRNTNSNANLANVMKQVANIFTDIAQLTNEHLSNDITPIANCSREYQGVTATASNILKKVMGQRGNDADEIERDEIMSYTMIAEMNHFYEHREKHLRNATKNTIKMKIQGYKNILKMLETVEELFE